MPMSLTTNSDSEGARDEVRPRQGSEERPDHLLLEPTPGSQEAGVRRGTSRNELSPGKRAGGRAVPHARRREARGSPESATARDRALGSPGVQKRRSLEGSRRVDQALRKIEDQFGRFRIESVKYRHAKQFYLNERAPSDRTGERERIGQAAGIIRVARIVWEFAIREEYCTENPFSRVRIKTAGHRQHKWTREQVYTFINVADEQGQWGIGTAAMIAFELCQRQGDAIRLSSKHFQINSIQVRQNKTDVLIWVPLDEDAVAEFRARIEDAIRRSPEGMAMQPDGTPWRENMNRFRHEFARLKALAGIPKELTFQDLRRSGLSELGDAGGTTDEMRSLSGHKSREILNAYVVPSAEQARNALRKRSAHRKSRKHAPDE